MPVDTQCQHSDWSCVDVCLKHSRHQTSLSKSPSVAFKYHPKALGHCHSGKDKMSGTPGDNPVSPHSPRIVRVSSVVQLVTSCFAWVISHF